MNDDTFALVVANDVKNKATPEQRTYLNLPENLDRWKRALEVLLENLDSQVQQLEKRLKDDEEAYGEDIPLYREAKTQFDSRVQRIERFRFHVETRLNEVNRKIILGEEDATDEDAPYQFLYRAVREHRALMKEYDFEPTPIDRALWAALDGKWEFDKVDIE